MDNDMPVARSTTWLLLGVGTALLAVGRITDQYGTWDLVKYFALLLAASLLISAGIAYFWKNEGDSLMNLCGQMLFWLVIMPGGAIYVIYHVAKFLLA